MKQFSISYISNSGLTILNLIVEARNYQEAIEDIKGTEGIKLILSIVPIAN